MGEPTAPAIMLALAPLCLGFASTPGHEDKKDDPCKCIGVDLQTKMGSSHGFSDNIAQYGDFCAAWDYLEGTPWKSYCPDDSENWCSSENWCMGSWCYVSPECPSFVPTSVFADINEDIGTIGYSYETCGSKNCYAGAYDDPPNMQAGCPDDPTGQLGCDATSGFDDRCKCIGIDEVWYTGGKFEKMPNIASYGDFCLAWDNLYGTPWNSYCPDDSENLCSSDNWCMGSWCYVDPSCPSFTPTSVFADVMDASTGLNLGYSYEACGSKDCYAVAGAEWCPDDPTGQLDCKDR